MASVPSAYQNIKHTCTHKYQTTLNALLSKYKTKAHMQEHLQIMLGTTQLWQGQSLQFIEKLLFRMYNIFAPILPLFRSNGGKIPLWVPRQFARASGDWRTRTASYPSTSATGKKESRCGGCLPLLAYFGGGFKIIKAGRLCFVHTLHSHHNHGIEPHTQNLCIRHS